MRKLILIAAMVMMCGGARAGDFCSYSTGAPIQDTDLMLLTEAACAAGATKSFTGQNLQDYGTLLDLADKTADYTLTSSDNVGGRQIRFQSSGNLTLTIPLASSVSFDTGRDIGVSMWGGGDLTIAFSSAAIGYTGALTFSSTSGQLINWGTNSWAIEGGQ